MKFFVVLLFVGFSLAAHANSGFYGRICHFRPKDSVSISIYRRSSGIYVHYCRDNGDLKCGENYQWSPIAANLEHVGSAEDPYFNVNLQDKALFIPKMRLRFEDDKVFISRGLFKREHHMTCEMDPYTNL